MTREEEIKKLTLDTFRLCADHHVKMINFHQKEALLAEDKSMPNHAEWHSKMIDLHTQIASSYQNYIKANDERN